jgi:hypothetical protein
VRRDGDAGQAAAVGREARVRVPPGGVGGVQQILALGHEQPQLVAPLAAGELADLLELFVVGAGDRHRAKERAPLRLEGRPGKFGRCRCA